MRALDEVVAKRCHSTVNQPADAGSLVLRWGPGLLAGTSVLIVAVILAGGWVSRPFGSAQRHPTPPIRTLLVLRPEPSPTGASIRNIWAIRSDGTGLRRITNESGDILDFTVAPDARRLILVVRDGLIGTDSWPTTALWRIDADGTHRTRLTAASDPAVYTDPAWSPAGDAVLYTRRELELIAPCTLGGTPVASAACGSPEVGVPRLWAMTPDGTPLKRVYGQAEEVTEAPVWSPDGAAVVFREGISEQEVTKLVITDLAAGFIKVPSGSLTRPTWSPDGQWLAYDEITSHGSVLSQIMLIRADGTGRRPLFSEQREHDIAPAWSPDGTVLAFVRRSRATPPAGAVAAATEVWTATRDGKDGRRLFAGAGRGSEGLSWSPDGTMLAATRFTIVGAAARGVWVVDADGSHPRELVKDAIHATWMPQE